LLILAIMVLPSIQKEYSFIELKPLKGAIEHTDAPSFSKESWLDASFQVEFDKYLEHNIGFRNFLVRLNNQLDFSLYKKFNAKGITLGKSGYLYEVYYINAYTGRDFKGEEHILDKCEKLKYVQQELQKSGVDLIPIINPGKAFYFPEFIPDKFNATGNEKTNYKTYKRQFDDMQVEYLDFNRWFKQMKDTVRYPLYPQLGIHWSDYGVALVMDSLIRYIECKRDTHMVDLQITGFDFPDDLRHADYDIADGMNLLCKLPYYKMAYPKIKYVETPDAYMPVVLTIGDSYYWHIFGQGHTQRFFSHNIYRYYNVQAYDDHTGSFTHIQQSEIEEDVFRNDFIFLMFTESTLARFALGFIEDVYFYLYNRDRMKSKIREIRGNGEWMEQIKEKAEESEVTIEEMIYLDAKWVIENNIGENNSN